jgi:hypothetical protein
MTRAVLARFTGWIGAAATKRGQGSDSAAYARRDGARCREVTGRVSHLAPLRAFHAAAQRTDQKRPFVAGARPEFSEQQLSD